MPLRLQGSCRCGAVTFCLDTHTPVPYQLCYCSICRKTAGGGGYAINMMGDHATLAIEGEARVRVFRALIADEDGVCGPSSGERSFCVECGTALWLWDETWPELVHPFASAIDTELPTPSERTHLMLAFKPAWVELVVGAKDQIFDLCPAESIEDWHRSRGLWID